MLDTQTWLYISLITVGIVVALALVVFSIMQVVVPVESMLSERLASVENESKASRLRRQRFEGLHVFFQVLIKLIQPFTQKMYGGNKKYLDRIRRLVLESGDIPTDTKIWQLLATQLIVGLGFGIVLSLFVLMSTQDLVKSVIGFIGGILAGRFLAEFKLKGRAKKRKENIHRSIPDVLDLLVICVEAGLGIDAALKRVSDESSVLAPDLSYELSRLSGELNAGIPRSEAFVNLGARTGVDELLSLCSMITQADKLGTSISKALRIYSDDLRTRRRQAAEELGHKASVKMIFPLVLLIFPSLFLVLMGPSVLRAIEHFGQQ